VQQLARLESQAAAGARWLSEAFGWLYLIGAVAITVNVLTRKFLGFSLYGITEIGGYLLALGIAFGLAHTLATRGHIRVDVLIRQIPWVGVRALLHTFALAALVLFGVVLTVRGWAVLDRSLKLGSRDLSALQIPLAIPQSLWLFGLVAFCALALLMLTRSLLLLAQRDFAAVDRIYAVETEQESALAMVEEVREEQGVHERSSPSTGRNEP
jgi:TRAP-type C4-dicarboxylate transport system permease small subunit